MNCSISCWYLISSYFAINLSLAKSFYEQRYHSFPTSFIISRGAISFISLAILTRVYLTKNI